MKNKPSSIFWGIVLMAAGLFGMAQGMGYETQQNPTLWTFIFGGIALISLIFYLVEGVKRWGWLLPAGIFGGLAFMLGMVAAGEDRPIMGAPIFIGIGLPFVAAYFIDRTKNWWALIPASVMAFFTAIMFVVDRIHGEWIGAGLFFTLAMIFFLVYLSKHANWAAIVAFRDVRVELSATTGNDHSPGNQRCTFLSSHQPAILIHILPIRRTLVGDHPGRHHADNGNPHRDYPANGYTFYRA
jgi:hypothetical protein